MSFVLSKKKKLHKWKCPKALQSLKLHFVCIITCIEAFITHENAINYTSKSAVIKMDWMNTRMVDSIHESLISDALPFSDAILLVAKEGPTGLRLTRMVTTYPSCFLFPRAWRENINTELRLWACLSTNVPFCTQILTRFKYFMKTKEEEKRIIFSGWKLLVQVSNLWHKTHNVVLLKYMWMYGLRLQRFFVLL